MKPSLIKTNPNNPRIIKDDKFKKLVQSLKDFPEMAVVRPVVINQDNMILGGNMRFKAMLEAGWDDIPVTQVKGWTKEQEQEFIIKDNVSGGEWDWDALANDYDLPTLESWGIDLPKDLQQTDVEEDEAPEVSQETPISKLGEVYQLGRHRLMCGDATKIGDVEKLMDGKKVDMVFTDPPWNMDYFVDDDKSWDEYKNWLNELLVMYGSMTENQGWFLSTKSLPFIADLFKGFIPFASVKNFSQMNKKTLPNCWDILFLRVSGYKGTGRNWFECNTAGMLKERTEHPTPRTLDVLEYVISMYSHMNILDPFGGSGSTLIACEQTNRTCYMMELDPKYCDVIRKRYSKFIGKETEWQTLTPAL